MPDTQSSQEAPQATAPTPGTRRRLGTSRSRETHQRWLQKESQQRARLYAEQWYQALRRWQVRVVQLPSPSAGRYQPDDQDLDFLTMGIGGPIMARYLSTPHGDVTEGTVAGLISRMQDSPVPDRAAIGGLLDRVRSSAKTPETLLREDGRWGRERPRVTAYAVAVLTLAVELRDPEAECHLAYARACQQGHVAVLAGSE